MKLNNKSEKLNSSSVEEKGATLFEFLLVFIILFPIIIGTIDFARILTAQSILSKATADAARRAASIEGFDGNTYATTPEGFEAKQNHIDALQKVEETAYAVSNSFIDRSEISGGGSATSWMKLLPYSAADGSTRKVDVAILRPGDKAELADSPGQFLVHATVCPPTGVCDSYDAAGNSAYRLKTPTSGFSSIYTTDDMEKVFREQPIMVEMRAEVTTLVPWYKIFGNGVGKILVRSFAYREQAPKGSNPNGKPTKTTGPCTYINCPSGQRPIPPTCACSSNGPCHGVTCPPGQTPDPYSNCSCVGPITTTSSSTTSSSTSSTSSSTTTTVTTTPTCTKTALDCGPGSNLNPTLCICSRPG